MALETATFINSLNTSWPDGATDQRSTADDHLRLIKAALQRTFPLIDGAVSVSQSQLTVLGSLSANMQSLIDAHFTTKFPLFDNPISVSDAVVNLLTGLTVNVQGEFNRIFAGGAAGTASGTVYYAHLATFLAGSLSASQFARTDTDNIMQGTQRFQKAISEAVKDLGTLSATLNIEPASANYFTVVLAGNVTNVSLGAALSAGQVLSVRIQQSGAGANTVTGWPAAVLWADGSTYSARTTASAYDLVTMIRDPHNVWFASSRKFG